LIDNKIQKIMCIVINRVDLSKMKREFFFRNNKLILEINMFIRCRIKIHIFFNNFNIIEQTALKMTKNQIFLKD